MTRIVSLAGSPNANSRSAQLLAYSEALLALAGFHIERFKIEDFPAEDLLYARTGSAAAQKFQAALAGADGLLVSTPVYKAAYSGALKTIIDLIPHRGLNGKFVLSVATGGNPGHGPHIAQALLPVWESLAVRHVVSNVFAAEHELTWQENGKLAIPDEIVERLKLSVSGFIAHLNANHVEQELAVA